jgi:hypothetical protein
MKLYKDQEVAKQKRMENIKSRRKSAVKPEKKPGKK